MNRLEIVSCIVKYMRTIRTYFHADGDLVSTSLREAEIEARSKRKTEHTLKNRRHCCITLHTSR